MKTFTLVVWVWKKTASSSPDATGSPGATIVLGRPLRHWPVAVVS
jgi:hypothetical protein